MSVPPYLRRKQGEPIGAAGRASEKQLTRQLGGKARPASGAMEGPRATLTSIRSFWRLRARSRTA